MHMSKWVLWLVVFVFAVSIGMMIVKNVFDDAKDLTLVSKGHSDYSIYVAANAPNSVKLGARELQQTVETATGVKLAITNVPVTPMICIGDNDASRQAGYSSESLAEETFVIAVKKGNVYIVGKDVLRTSDDGASCGSLYGVYEFLERFLDARWLMPGKVGEDIPKHDVITMPIGTIRGGTVERQSGIRVSPGNRK